MPITAQYQTYYGIHLNHWTERWGNTDYNKILTKEYFSADAVETGSTAIASTITFLYPRIVSTGYFLDGIAGGHFKLYNTTGGALTVTDYTITVAKINNNGTSTNLAIHDETISYSLPAGDIVALPIQLSFSESEVKANEKLVLKLDVTGSAGIVFMHFNGLLDGEAEIELRLPYAPTIGGG